MAIVTRPATSEYHEGYERVWGKRCLRCRRPLDPERPEEWEGGQHPGCEPVFPPDDGATTSTPRTEEGK